MRTLIGQINILIMSSGLNKWFNPSEPQDYDLNSDNSEDLKRSGFHLNPHDYQEMTDEIMGREKFGENHQQGGNLAFQLR